MPPSDPQLGETWQMSTFEGAVSRSCIVAIRDDVALLASNRGRTVAVPIRSLVQIWRFVAPSRPGWSCSTVGCPELAYVTQQAEGAAPREVCHRHIVQGQPVLFPFSIAEDAPVAEAAPAPPPPMEGVQLDECPHCHAEPREGMPFRTGVPCWRCRATWRTVNIIGTDVAPIANAVSQARRDMRQAGRDASYLTMPEVLGRRIIVDNLRGNTNTLVSRGTFVGGGPTFAGLSVVYREGPVTLISALASTNALGVVTGDSYLRMSDCVGFIQSGLGLPIVLHRIGHPIGTDTISVSEEEIRAGFRLIADAVPPANSFWRDPNDDGSFITVTGYQQNAGEPLHVTYATPGGINYRVPLLAFQSRFIRFDLGVAPSIGSVWIMRGRQQERSLITEVGETNGELFVDMRNVRGASLRMLIPDLWRNYTQVTTGLAVPCAEGEEWADGVGACHIVTHVDRELGVATMRSVARGDMTQIVSEAFAQWTRVERRDALSRLDDDIFGDGNA